MESQPVFMFDAHKKTWAELELESERPAIQGHPRVSFVAQGHSVHTVGSTIPEDSDSSTEDVWSDVESVPDIAPKSAVGSASLGGEEETSAAIVIFGVEARAALGRLDHVDLEVELATRACVMKSPPAFIKG